MLAVTSIDGIRGSTQNQAAAAAAALLLSNERWNANKDCVRAFGWTEFNFASPLQADVVVIENAKNWRRRAAEHWDFQVNKNARQDYEERKLLNNCRPLEHTRWSVTFLPLTSIMNDFTCNWNILWNILFFCWQPNDGLIS